MSSKAGAPPPMPHEVEVLSEWKDIQSRLAKLYTGPDPMFATTAICANCKGVAVNAKDCNGCNKLICSVCAEKQGGQCKHCNEPFTTLKALHPVEAALFDRATFKCPHPGCDITDCPWSEFENHIFH